MPAALTTLWGDCTSRLGGLEKAPFLCHGKSRRFQRGQLYIERQIRREGPPVVYVAYYRQSSCGFTDQARLLKWLKLGRGTETRTSLEAWLEAFNDQKYQRPELDPEQVKKEGFGPEAHLDESDPNHQTKMVT